jgi:predicted alpha/beta-hydrolase family hydrolase
MEHRFMCDVSDGLSERDIATLRFQFPFMERGLGRPDSAAVAHRTVRAAVAAASALFPDLPLFAGGKSFGGRMTSGAQALQPMALLRGLVFLGFPLHQPGKPSNERADHLRDVDIPMLFVQGTRDKMAEIDRMDAVVSGLSSKANLVPIAGADHSFHVLVRSGRTDADVLTEILGAMKDWIAHMV